MPSVPSDKSLGYYQTTLRVEHVELASSVPSDKSLGYYQTTLRVEILAVDASR